MERSHSEAISKANHPIKIEAVEPILIKPTTRGYAFLIVRIRTNQGIDGIGECHASGEARSLAIRDFVDSMSGELEGTNPLEIEAFLNRAGQGGSGWEWFAAVSAIEIAMWDILGQMAGLPIYMLLGGRVRERIPLYANHGVFADAKTVEERVERAVSTKEMGFDMFKWDPFGYYGIQGTPETAQLDGAIKEVEAMRSALGADFNMAIDAHARFSLEGALMTVKALEPLNPFFFEEPTNPPDQPNLIKQVVDSTSIPIATGELLSERRSAEKVLAGSGIQFLQSEVGNNGGILETFKVAAMAEAHDVKMAPHNWCGPVLARATAHVCTTIPNLAYMEYAGTAPEAAWEYDLIDPPLQIENGELIPSDLPGLGSKLNEDVVAARRID